MNILVAKRNDLITISVDSKKLLIDKGNELFELLNAKTKNEIKVWYETNRFNKLLELNNKIFN